MRTNILISLLLLTSSTRAVKIFRYKKDPLIEEGNGDTDIDADGQRDSLLDQANIPIWVDKSINAKDAIQTLVNQMPTYEENGFGSIPSVKFSSGKSMKVGILSNLSGPLNIFASAYGDGVVIGGDDGQNPWTLEASSYNWLNVFRGENESLQQITLGLDPRTNLGMLTGSI